MSEDNKVIVDDSLAMYVFINDDLKMGKGKIAGQTGHAVHYLIKSLEQMKHQCMTIPDSCKRYDRWEKEGCAKIVLKATGEQLEQLRLLPESVYVIDAGKTQIAPGSLTAVGFYPNTKLSMMSVTKDYKLL